MPAEQFKVLVTGSGGQLGAELARLSWPGNFQVACKARGELDIADRAAVGTEIQDGGYDLVVNAAAFTAVDRAESETQAALAANQLGPANLAQACGRVGAALIHISTDYVFDGAKTAPYLEDDTVSPLGAYGRSKEAGEGEVRRALRRHVILRTAWVYGVHGGNFVKTVLRLIGERGEVRIVADQHGSPTSSRDLGRAIVTIATRLAHDRERGAATPWGTYHCVNDGEASWHDFAVEIAALAGPWLGRTPRVVPISTSEYPTPAKRPANSRLDCAKLEGAFGIRLRPWREALAEVIEDLRREQAHTQREEAST